MRKNSQKMRCGNYFRAYTLELKKQAGVSDTQLTDGLARFLDEEHLTPILIKRAQESRKQRQRRIF